MRTGFGGLNQTGLIDTGEITDGSGFTSAHLPEIRSVRTPKTIRTFALEVISTAAIADILLVVAFDGSNTNLYYLRGGEMYVGRLASGRDDRPRSIVQFNVYNDALSIVGDFSKKLLIFPDKKSMDYDIAENFTLFDINTTENPIPNIDYATVYNARLFGVKDGKIYASGFNNYANFNLDTATGISEGNAWASETQSNPKAQNTFVALTVYDGHPIGFKPDYMQTVYNTKNPFRIVDIGEFGCVSNKAHCQCGGALFFASKDGVYRFGGGYPVKISDKLNITDYTNAELAAYKDDVYMNINGDIYTYSVVTGAWARGESLEGMGNMVATTEGVYIFGGNIIAKLREGDAYYDMEIALGNIAMQTTDNKRPKEIAALYRLNGEGSVSLCVSDGERKAEKDTTKAGTHSARLLTRGIAGDIHSIRIRTTGEVALCYLQYIFTRGGNTYGN
jgi:hypothetical protein